MDLTISQFVLAAGLGPLGFIEPCAPLGDGARAVASVEVVSISKLSRRRFVVTKSTPLADADRPGTAWPTALLNHHVAGAGFGNLNRGHSKDRMSGSARKGSVGTGTASVQCA